MPDRNITIAARDLTVEIEGRDLALALGNAPGAQGVAGAAGAAGATGATGATGPAGPAGADGAPGPGVETADVRIHINGSTGSDLTGDGSSGNPVATMAGAAALAPEVSTAAVIYQFDGVGNYAWAECPTVFGSTGHWALYAHASTRVSVLASGTAGVGTDANAIAASGLTVNQYQHFTLEMTSGAALGYRRTVQQNTATSIAPVRRFENQAGTSAVTPASGDTYAIYRPGVVITGLTSLTGKRVVWWDIAFDTVTASPPITHCEIYAAGVEFRGTVFPHFLDCRGSFGMWDHIDSGSVPVNTAFTHWSLPSSTAQSTKVAAYFASVEQSTSIDTLALHRGCGVSCPSVVATVTSTTGGHMLFTQCAMSLLGVFGAVSHDQGVYLIGGYYWGNCRAHAQSNVVVTGKCGSGVNVAESTYFRRRIDLDRNSSMFCASPITSMPGGFAFVNVIDGSTLTFAGTGNVLGNGTANDNLGTVDQNGTVNFTGTTTLAFNVSPQSYNSFGGSTLFNHGRTRFLAATTITNAGNRPYWVRNAIMLVDAAVTYTGAGGVLVSDNGMVRCTSTLTVTNGPITVDGGHFTMGANVSVVTPPGDALIVKNGGNFVQAAGILSCVATAGDGLSCEAGGKARLRSSTNTVLTGAGAGNVGCRAKAGAQVWFDGAPTSVTGPADLQVAGTTYPNTDLSADHTFVTDGSGTTIGRAA